MKNCRTIKPSDRIGHETPQNMLIISSQVNARNDASYVCNELARMQTQLQNELSAPKPNVARIARIQRAIADLSGTHQRQR